MRICRAKLKSVSPYSQSRHYEVPKVDNGKESSSNYEIRTWRERLHYLEDGTIYIPPMAFKNAMSEVAKFLSIKIEGKGAATYTKHFEAGVLVTEPLLLPIKKDDVEGEWLFVPSDGRRGGGKRVSKCFPLIREWEGVVTFYILDETITPEVFDLFLKEAGNFIGIGRFRPKNNGFYGRFEVVSTEWSTKS
jgi:hypothetical protein